MPRGINNSILSAVLRRQVGGGIANPPLSTQVEQLEAANSASVTQKSSASIKQEQQKRSPIDGLGNVFLLGMTVLISEIIDLTAAKSLEYLLEPCMPKDGETAEEAALAEDVGITDVELEEGEFIPISFE